jgi:hypothetical protein
MLHEVLLALSGHPSPLFNDSDPSQLPKDAPAVEEFGLLTASERASLRSIGHLSELHRKTRNHIERIAQTHSSTICRAVATSIQQVHLARFQDKILAVESKILTKDTTLVGAYDIVPLAGVVGEFDEWHRRMQWFWEITRFMESNEPNANETSRCTGAGLIDRLRLEQQTGYPDIESVAIELSNVAETAWLRQLASWVLYGKLPSFGADDFFIIPRNVEHGEHASFLKDKDLLPRFVSAPTASSILFIGKSLHQIRKYGRQNGTTRGQSGHSLAESNLVAAHLEHLSELQLPLVSAQLSRAISAIRLSLSQNVLKLLLPMNVTLEVLSCLREFFLLGRGDFATTLIQEAEKRLHARQESMGRLLQQDPVKALQGLSIKDAEFHQTMSQTWKALASQDEDASDDILDFARKHVTLSAPADVDSRPSTSDSVYGASAHLSSISFTDLLFPNAASLRLSVNPPLDLFVSQKDIETYSNINSYLIAIRRARLRLSDLWRRTPARRDHPAPASSSTVTAAEIRQRTISRRVASRKVWATTSAALFLLSETSAYFEGEIIRESWNQFEDWVKQPASEELLDASHRSSATESTDGAVTQKDPETLASGHRAFLASLTYALLLNDILYTKEIRSLLGNVDHLIAFFNRQLEIHQKLDIEHDSDGETAYTTEEERRISLELDRARKRVDSDLKSVVNRLRQLDQERIGSGRYLTVSTADSEFEPWKGGGVDRLLMKLEFGRMIEDDLNVV